MIVLALQTAAMGAVTTIKPDIEYKDGAWLTSIKMQADTGGYAAVFDTTTSGIAAECGGRLGAGYSPLASTFGKSEKLECSYMDFSSAMKQTVESIHDLADSSERDFDVQVNGYTIEFYTRERDTSADPYVYTQRAIPDDAAFYANIPAMPANPSAVAGYEFGADIDIDKGEVTFSVKVKDKKEIVNAEGEVKLVSQKYYTFPETSLDTHSLCSDPSKLVWMPFDTPSDDGYSNEFVCRYPDYGTAYVQAVKIGLGLARAGQQGGNITALSFGKYSLGITRSFQIQENSPVFEGLDITGMGTTPSEIPDICPNEDQPATECPERPSSCDFCDPDGDRKVSMSDIVKLLQVMAGGGK